MATANTLITSNTVVIEVPGKDITSCPRVRQKLIKIPGSLFHYVHHLFDYYDVYRMISEFRFSYSNGVLVCKECEGHRYVGL